jgi:hypothetical protein
VKTNIKARVNPAISKRNRHIFLSKADQAFMNLSFRKADRPGGNEIFPPVGYPLFYLAGWVFR